MSANDRIGPGSGSATGWRFLDSGDLTAAENIAMDAMLLSLRARHRIPDTLRILSFSRPAALIGYNQSPDTELRLDYCGSRNIEINRRITGGGAVYIDSCQLGWELIASRRSLPVRNELAAVTAFICETVAEALGILGVNAVFRPRNDIEIGGRKISGTGGAYEGDALLFQGTLLVDADPVEMIRALRIPTEKLLPREISSARERVTCLSEHVAVLPDRKAIGAALRKAFSSALLTEFQQDGLSQEEEAELKGHIKRHRSRSWVWRDDLPRDSGLILRSVHRGRGGTIRSAVSLDERRNIIKSVHFRGDYFASPARAAYDLEAALKDCPVGARRVRLRKFFSRDEVDFMDLGPDDFEKALNSALSKLFFMDMGMSEDAADDITPVGKLSIRSMLERAGVLLLPYCAKPPGCEYRSIDGCDECGECSVGEAYEMAYARGLDVVSINDYQHLVRTLERIKARGVKAFIGCCCHAFMVKRWRTFDESGLSGLLVDIGDSTCYDLSRDQEALEGGFEEQTELKIAILQRLLHLVPGGDRACHRSAGGGIR